MTRQELQTWRIAKGLREKDVAEMFGHTEEEIKRYESGRTAIPAKFNKHIKTG